jgi:hypothetical protein
LLWLLQDWTSKIDSPQGWLLRARVGVAVAREINTILAPAIRLEGRYRGNRYKTGSGPGGVSRHCISPPIVIHVTDNLRRMVPG